LVIIPGLTYQLSRENFATEATIEAIHFPIGILSKRDIEDLINQDIEKEGY
jgi:hypothetical protein